MAAPGRSVPRGALLAAVMLAGAMGAVPTRAAPPPAGIGVPDTTTLANGLRVAVFARHRLPIVQFELLLPAGVADEPADGSGLANATAQLVLRGTSSRPASQFAADVAALGGSIGASAGRDFTTLTGAFRAADLDPGLELLSDAVLHPVFGDSELEQFRRETLDALLRIHASPAAVAEEELWASVMRGHPYGRPLFGTPAGATAMTPAALQAFHRDHYRPDRAVLVIAGDVSAERAFAAAREWFGPWAGTAAPPRAPSPPAPLPHTQVRIVDRPGTHAEIRIGLPGPARASADFLPLQMANHVLGGGPASRLQTHDREGSTGEVRSGLAGLADAGLLSLAGDADADSAAALCGRLLGELRQLAAQPPTDAELAAARRALAGAWPLQFETLGALEAQWLSFDFAHLPPTALDDQPARIRAVTAGQVTDALQRWVDPAPAWIVAVGPASVLRSALERLGPVELSGPPGAAAAPAATPPPSRAPRPASPEQQRRGRLVVTQAVTAHGGDLRLRRVEDSVMEGSMTVSTPDGREITGEMQQVRKEPWKMLLATRLMGFDTQQVLDGRHGWLRYGGDSVVVSDADSTTVDGLRAGFSADIVHLLRSAASPGTRVAWRGRATIGGREADIVDADAREAEPRRLYFDRLTHRLVAMDQNEERPGSGTYNTRRIYKDYHPVAGVWWPYYEERLLSGRRVMTLSLQRVAFNTGVEDATFRKPAAGERSFAR
jgi:predicted Zn-dependent peptidase